MSQKKLIINADDFGICHSTNSAIRQLFADKKITSCSLLANAMATDEALVIAKENGIKVGCHLALNSDFAERPWQSVAKNPKNSLLDSNGYLYFDTKMLARRAKSRDVYAECIAQINKIKDAGVEIDHLDNHSGTMYGINKRLFFIIAFRLAKQYDLPFRFPRKSYFLDDYFNSGTPAIVKGLQQIVVGVSKLMGARIIDNMISSPHAIKDIDSYKDLENYYINALNNIEVGVTELFLHPSYHSDTFAPLTPEWKKREYELEFLYSQALERCIKDNGITLISYNDVK